MDDLQLLVDLHKGGARQGPGSEEATRQAIALAGLTGRKDIRIADIGCGTGASTLTLAETLDARITAVDFLPEFLDLLSATARAAGLDDRITPLVASMDALPFEESAFDAIWSEGAIYNIGFARGVELWRPFLKPGGILAVSELTWLTRERPKELTDHWAAAYPEVDTASAKIAVLERLGFTLLGYFPLPEACWLENYYRPLEQRFAGFLDRHNRTEAAKAILAGEKQEIALYERNRNFVSYGFYVARKAV